MCPSAVWGDWHTRCMTGIAGSDAFCYFGFPAITTCVRVTLSFHTDPSAYQGSLDVYPSTTDGQGCPPRSQRRKSPRPLLVDKLWAKSPQSTKFGCFCGITEGFGARQASPQAPRAPPRPPRAGTPREAPTAGRAHNPTHLFGRQSYRIPPICPISPRPATWVKG